MRRLVQLIEDSAAGRDIKRAAPMSRFEDPAIITCSISGAVANREQCPAIPYTPEEYAAEAKRAVDEGGSMIHIHARTPDGVPTLRGGGLPGDHGGDPRRRATT